MAMSKEKIKESQAKLKEQRIRDLALGKPVAELDHLALKHATHTPFSIGLKAGRMLSDRTLDCVGGIKPIYKTIDSKIIKGYQITSERIEEINGEIVKTQIIQETFRPIIFVISHIGKFDIEMVAEKLPHFFLLSGDYENLHGTLSGLLLEKHGIVYVDMFDKDDKKNVKEVSKQVLSSGNNMLWCIEGIHNMSPNELILQCPFGVGEVSESAGAVLLPIGIQQFNDINFSMRFGELIDPIKIRSNCYLNDLETKNRITREARDGMATQVYSIIEEQGLNSRFWVDIQDHEEYVEKRLAEWKFTREEIEKKTFKPPYITENEDAFKHMQKVMTVPPYLLNKRFAGIKR